jgi:SOS-response transcriptional repressor LexA
MLYNKPFGIVNKEVLHDPELSIQAKGLYSLLCTYADKNRTCYPSINTLADLTNKSVRSISELIKELKQKNYLRRDGRKIILI